MAACGTEIETTEHFLLRCQFSTNQRLEFLENFEEVEQNFKCKKLSSYFIVFSNLKNLNQEILKNVIFYFKATARFDRPLIDF